MDFGKTEDQFLQGMLYVLLDAAIQIATLAALVVYVKRVVEVDTMHVGYFVLRRHASFYWWIHPCACFTFILAFTRHNGCDTAFDFAWLEPGFASRYDPHNATSALTKSVLWA